MKQTYIEQLKDHIGSEVTLESWLYNSRSRGRLIFLQLPVDGTSTATPFAANRPRCVALPEIWNSTAVGLVNAALPVIRALNGTSPFAVMFRVLAISFHSSPTAALVKTLAGLLTDPEIAGAAGPNVIVIITIVAIRQVSCLICLIVLFTGLFSSFDLAYIVQNSCLFPWIGIDFSRNPFRYETSAHLKPRS